MARIVPAREYAAGATVFGVGDRSQGFHLIATGRAGVQATTETGHVITLSILGPGDTFGELSILTEQRRTASVVALGPLRTHTLGAEQFKAALADPDVSAWLVRSLASQVVRLTDLVVDALFTPAEARVLRRLVELSHSLPATQRLIVQITQAELANLSGTARPTANRALRAAETQGQIVLHRSHIEVIDLAALEAAAGKSVAV